MKEIRKPLKRSLLRGIALFIAVLCVCLSGAQYFSMRHAMYNQYESRIGSILNLALSGNFKRPSQSWTQSQNRPESTICISSYRSIQPRQTTS